MDTKIIVTLIFLVFAILISLAVARGQLNITSIFNQHLQQHMPSATPKVQIVWPGTDSYLTFYKSQDGYYWSYIVIRSSKDFKYFNLVTSFPLHGQPVPVFLYKKNGYYYYKLVFKAENVHTDGDTIAVRVDSDVLSNTITIFPDIQSVSKNYKIEIASAYLVNNSVIRSFILLSATSDLLSSETPKIVVNTINYGQAFTYNSSTIQLDGKTYNAEVLINDRPAQFGQKVKSGDVVTFVVQPGQSVVQTIASGLAVPVLVQFNNNSKLSDMKKISLKMTAKQQLSSTNTVSISEYTFGVSNYSYYKFTSPPSVYMRASPIVDNSNASNEYDMIAVLATTNTRAFVFAKKNGDMFDLDKSFVLKVNFKTFRTIKHVVINNNIMYVWTGLTTNSPDIVEIDLSTDKIIGATRFYTIPQAFVTTENNNVYYAYIENYGDSTSNKLVLLKGTLNSPYFSKELTIDLSSYSMLVGTTSNIIQRFYAVNNTLVLVAQVYYNSKYYELLLTINGTDLSVEHAYLIGLANAYTAQIHTTKSFVLISYVNNNYVHLIVYNVKTNKFTTKQFKFSSSYAIKLINNYIALKNSSSVDYAIFNENLTYVSGLEISSTLTVFTNDDGYSNNNVFVADKDVLNYNYNVESFITLTKTNYKIKLDNSTESIEDFTSSVEAVSNVQTWTGADSMLDYPFSNVASSYTVFKLNANDLQYKVTYNVAYSPFQLS